MESQKPFKKLVDKVRDKNIFVFDHNFKYQQGLRYQSKARDKNAVFVKVRQVDTFLIFKRNKEQNKIYTFNIHCCSQYDVKTVQKLRFCNKSSHIHSKVLLNKNFVSLKARTTSKWSAKRLCAKKKMTFQLMTPQAFVASVIAYKQRVNSLLTSIKELPFLFTFAQPYQILGLESFYQICGTKKRYLPVINLLPLQKLFVFSCDFGNKMVYKNVVFVTNKVPVKATSMKPSFSVTKLSKNKVFVTNNTFVKVKALVELTYGEDIKNLCSTFAKPNSCILKRCENLNNVSEYRILALRSSATFDKERKKHKIIRPLLDFKRESITMVCKDLQIPVYPDKSNRSVQYSRNRIRKQIIPSIKYFINPQVENSLFKVAQLLQKEQFFVYSLLKNSSVNVHL